MLSVELETNELGECRLIINGVKLENSEAELGPNEEGLYGFVTSESDAKHLSSYKFCDLAAYFITLSLPFKVAWNKYLENVEILLTSEDGTPANSLLFQGMA